MSKQSYQQIFRDHPVLIVSAVALLASSPFVTNMMIRAWESPGHISTIIHGIGDALGVGFDVVLIFTTGLYIGFLVLFLFDEAKKLQAVIVLFSSIIIGFVLISGGHWVTGINWYANLPWAVLGFLIALPIGGLVHFVQRDVPREFPRAANIILITLTVAAVVGFFEAHLRYTTTESLSLVTSSLLSDFGFMVVFVGTLGHFLSYSYRKDVFVVSKDPKIKTAFIAELFHYTRRYRKAREWGPRSAGLNRVATHLQYGNEIEPIEGELRLRFKTQSLFAMWVSVVTEGAEIGKLSEGNLTELERNYRQKSSLQRVFQLLSTATALWSRQGQSGVARHIDEADIVLLIFDTENALRRAEPDAEYLTKYRRIHDAISSEKRVIPVAMNASAGLNAFEDSPYHNTDKSISSREYRIFLSDKAFGGRLGDTMDFVPVDRFDQEQFAKNIDEIVNKLEP